VLAVVRVFQQPMPEQPKDRVGRRGERIARRFLRWRKGYRIIESNWRPSRFGELDIVALDRETLVFVEVKALRREVPADPEDAVIPEKQQRLRRLALSFVSQYSLSHLPCRFDVLAVTVQRWPWPAKVVHYKDAF